MVFRLNGALRDVNNCFCAQCWKTSGLQVAATSVFNADLELLIQDTLKCFRSSDQARRGFCGECGRSLFWQRDGDETTSIMAGTIDAPTGLVTAQNIFLKDKSDYHEPPTLRRSATL